MGDWVAAKAIHRLGCCFLTFCINYHAQMAICVDGQRSVLESNYFIIQPKIAHAIARCMHVVLLPPSMEIRRHLLQFVHQFSDVAFLVSTSIVAPEVRQHPWCLFIPVGKRSAKSLIGELHPKKVAPYRRMTLEVKEVVGRFVEG